MTEDYYLSPRTLSYSPDTMKCQISLTFVVDGHNHKRVNADGLDLLPLLLTFPDCVSKRGRTAALVPGLFAALCCFGFLCFHPQIS